MFRLTPGDVNIITICLEGFLYGIYSGIFLIYLQCHVAKKAANKFQNVIFYSICILYLLSVALFVSNIAKLTFDMWLQTPRTSVDMLQHIHIAQITLFGCCDFIAQFILIYRCWIVWRRNIGVVIIPSVLAIVFLVVWLLPSQPYIISDEVAIAHLGSVLVLLGLTLSLTVNSLVTGLIVFRIFKVFREVRATSDEQILGATGGNKLRKIIFILIESGTALFAIQVVRVTMSIVGTTETAVIPIVFHEMFTGITPTFILVRTTMGLSFDEDKSMEDVAIESLRFTSNHANSVLEMGSIVDEDRRVDDDYIGIRQENDIEVVER